MTSYFNSNVPLYISDGQLNNLTDQVAQNQLDIDAIEFSIAPDLVQNFKQSVGFFDNSLIAGSFVPLAGSDAVSVLPSNWNSLGPLHFQYEGQPTAYFLIGYTVSGLLNTISEGITFAIRENSTILPASANVQHYNTTEYVTTSGFIIRRILPNDTIRLEAQLLGGTDDILRLENVNLFIAKLNVEAL